MNVVKEETVWEVEVEIGNDWGEDSEFQTYSYNNKEEAIKRAQDAIDDYYDRLVSLKEVVYYKVGV